MNTKYVRFLTLALVVSLAMAATFPGDTTNKEGDVVFINTKGKSFDEVVKQFKGKVVYVDFWATWCGPCRGQMPYSRKLHEAYKGKDVAFLYISFDRGENAWKKGIEKMKIKGYHWKPDRKQLTEINKRFNVRYIPRYMLIGKDGKILTDDTVRPGNSRIGKLINKALEM